MNWIFFSLRRGCGFLARISLFLGVVLGGAAETAPVKRIYLANDDHTDYFWSAADETYRAAFLEMLDYYLNLADATQHHPPEWQSRWNCDGHLSLWTYEQNRSPLEFQRLIERIRSGHISVPLNPLACAFGGTPAEAVIRSAYYPGQIERRYHLRFLLASAVEDQTQPYGLGALWAGCGAKYSWKGICNCATRIPALGTRRPHEIYYWVGPDGSELLLKWNSLLGENQALGGYAEARNPAAVVDYLDQNPTFSSHYPWRVMGAFGKGWDDLKTLTYEFITVASNKTTATRKVIVSNEVDFFQDFEATHGADIPRYNASFGNEWELYVASLAEVSARVKRAVEKLRAAEALATLVSLRQPGFMQGRSAAGDLAFMNLGLYYEHDWTADSPNIPRSVRADWHRRLTGEIESYVDALHADAAAALAGMVRRSGTNLQFFAFNPLSWQRTDYVDLLVPGTNIVHVVDTSTGFEAPAQLMTNSGQRHLRVLAHDIPPVGYKVFELRPGPGAHYEPAATINGTNRLENRYYRLALSGSGAITSLVDKVHGNVELVRAIEGRALNDLGASSGTIEVVDAGPVSVTLRATAMAPVNHQTHVTLVRDSPRIEIRNIITQGFSNTLTWDFCFNLAPPEVWHEEVGAVIRARLLTDDGHYAPSHARYDWLTLNHFADVQGGNLGVTLANADCYYFRLGRSGISNLDTHLPRLSVLAGGQVDGPNLGIPNQGGDTNFLQRFALRTRVAFNPADAMRFALEFQNPLVAGLLTGGKDYPENSFSLLSISAPEVLLWALKPAEEGVTSGIIARVWNLAPQATNFALTWAYPLKQARRTTHIETDLEAATVTNGSLQAPIKGQQILTFRLHATPFKSSP